MECEWRSILLHRPPAQIPISPSDSKWRWGVGRNGGARLAIGHTITITWCHEICGTISWHGTLCPVKWPIWKLLRTIPTGMPFQAGTSHIRRLLEACSWYAALGRVVNFEMCHLRTLGRVAKFKKHVFRNGGIGFEFWCCKSVAHAVVWSSGGWGGWGGCINVLDEYVTYVTQHVSVV